MDIITRRSWGFSIVFHAGIVVVAFWPGGCSLTPPPPPMTVQALFAVGPSKPLSAAHQTHAAPLHLILVPDEAPSPPLPLLHQLMPPGLNLPSTPLITPRNIDHPGDLTSIGTAGTTPSRVMLPAAIRQSDDAIAQLRSHRTSNTALDHAQRQLQTTQEFLEDVLNMHIKETWFIPLRTIAEKRLIIEAMVNADGTVMAHLVNSSGDSHLDHLIDQWLSSSDLRLPPIRPGIRSIFLVMIHR
jgi:hypothetical protein